MNPSILVNRVDVNSSSSGLLSFRALVDLSKAYEVKTNTGLLYAVWVDNFAGAQQLYLNYYLSPGATIGTTLPNLSIPIPLSTGYDFNWGMFGLQFSYLAFSISTDNIGTVAPSGTTLVQANYI